MAFRRLNGCQVIAAYILIETEAGKAATVAAALRESATYTPPVVAIISGGNLSPEDLAKYTA